MAELPSKLIPTSVMMMSSGSDTASPSRRERRAQETRSAIIAAARELFDAHGYADTTVEAIASAADVAPRTFFRYFPSKESLIFAPLDDVREALLRSLRERPDHEDPMTSLSISFGRLADMADERRDDLVWGLRMSEQVRVESLYERIVMRDQIRAEVAEFIAGRLGVDPDIDHRPLAWAAATLAVFAEATRMGATAEPPEPARPSRQLDELLRSTGEALIRIADAPA